MPIRYTRKHYCAVCGKQAKYLDKYYKGNIRIYRCSKHHDKRLSKNNSIYLKSETTKRNPRKGGKK